MTSPRNPGHVKQGDDSPVDDVPRRGLQQANEARSGGLPGEEPRDVHKAGGGTLGEQLGGAHTGRYGAAPGKVVSNRERKPRGQDKND